MRPAYAKGVVLTRVIRGKISCLGTIPRWPLILFVFLLSIASPAHAEKTLIASWYSIQSLKDEGTYKYSKGVMANGNYFRNDGLTCVAYGYNFGESLRVTNLSNNKSVVVVVTDHIGKRFAKKRIDLSKLAFSRIAKLETGIVAVRVERIDPR